MPRYDLLLRGGRLVDPENHVDMGDVVGVIEEFPDRGCGLNIAGLQIAGPPWPHGEPSAQDIAGFVDDVMAAGAIGIKILGAYRPATLRARSAVFNCFWSGSASGPPGQNPCPFARCPLR